MAIVHSLYREAGVVRIDEEDCSRCGSCAQVCPADVLEMENGRVRVRADSALGCVACGHCMMVCPEGSITVTGRGLSPNDLLPLPAAEQLLGMQLRPTPGTWRAWVAVRVQRGLAWLGRLRR